MGSSRKNVRLAQHCLRDAEALLHPVRIGADRPVESPTERRDVESLLEARLLGRPSGGPPEGLEVLAAGQMRQEAGALDQSADATEDRRAGSDQVSGRGRCPSRAG